MPKAILSALRVRSACLFNIPLLSMLVTRISRVRVLRTPPCGRAPTQPLAGGWIPEELEPNKILIPMRNDSGTQFA